MSTVRLRRLQADFAKVQEYVYRHPRVQLIQTEGDPPERYQLQYEISSLRQKDEQLVVAKTHMVEIALPRNYPRNPPQCRMLTPIFHPNIAPHAICIGDHWSAGEPLASIVARIGELIAYQSYNTKSPLNGEAARWVSENLDRLPLDPVSMLVEEPPANGQGEALAPKAPPREEPLPTWMEEPQSAPPLPPPPPQVPLGSRDLQPIQFPCPECGAMLRIRAELVGKQVRCPRCKNIPGGPDGSAAS